MYWISPQPLTGWLWQRPPLVHPLSCGPLCVDPGETHGGAVVVVGGAAIVTDDETGSPANGPETRVEDADQASPSGSLGDLQVWSAFVDL